MVAPSMLSSCGIGISSEGVKDINNCKKLTLLIYYNHIKNVFQEPHNENAVIATSQNKALELHFVCT